MVILNCISCLGYLHIFQTFYRFKNNCISIGKEVEVPLGYIIPEFRPSGSSIILCLSLSENLLILSSIEGQYLGPFDAIAPLYKGLSFKDLLIILWVSYWSMPYDKATVYCNFTTIDRKNSGQYLHHLFLKIKVNRTFLLSRVFLSSTFPPVSSKTSKIHLVRQRIFH